MRRIFAVIVCGLIGSSVLLADVRSEEKSQVKFEGMLGRMVGIFGGRGAREGITTTVVVKGDRKMTTTDNRAQLIDLKEEKIYDIDLRDKSYKVTTFAQLRQQMEDARRKAAEQQKKEEPGAGQPSGREMDVDFSLKNTGEKRAVNGFDAHEVLMTITVREKGKTLEQSGGMVLTNNIWLAPKVPGMSEVAEFDKRYAEKLASPMMLDAQQMAAIAAMYPMIQQAMTRMQAEDVKMDGTPVMTDVKFETVASAEQAAQASAAKKDEPPPTSLGGLGGRLGRKVLSRGKDKDKDDAAAAAAPGHATVMSMHHEVLKVTPQATEADVAVPAGFKLKS